MKERDCLSDLNCAGFFRLQREAERCGRQGMVFFKVGHSREFSNLL